MLQMEEFSSNILFVFLEFYFYLQCNEILNLKTIITEGLLYMLFYRKSYLLEPLLQEMEFTHQHLKYALAL